MQDVEIIPPAKPIRRESPLFTSIPQEAAIITPPAIVALIKSVIWNFYLKSPFTANADKQLPDRDSIVFTMASDL